MIAPSRTDVARRLHYRFDSFMSKGGRSMFTILTAVFVSLLIIVGLMRAAFLATGAEQAQNGGGVWRNLYIAFLQITAPGNMSQDLNSTAGFKAAAVIAGLAGVIMVSTLIAFITTSLDQRLTQLRKGHSRVMEHGHTLILGWNPQRVTEMIRELVLANESESDAAVVILADLDKSDMDDFIELQVRDLKTTRVVTRSGNPTLPNSLALVAAPSAKSVIVLASCSDTADDDAKAASDARVLKTLLALVAEETPTQTHHSGIVAELFDPALRGIASDLSPDRVVALDASDILAKLLVQTSRSVGLSVVYNEILSFDGSEMYFSEGPWAGELSFGQSAFRFGDGVPVGLRDVAGVLHLNPAPDRALEAGDTLLVLATDDSAIHFESAPVADATLTAKTDLRGVRRIERELLVGWTDKTATIIEEYSDYVEPGSAIDVMLRSPDPTVAGEVRDLDERLQDVSISLVERDALDPATWVDIDPESYDNIVILSQRTSAHDDDRVDAETITILLLLRRVLGSSASPHGTKLITELVVSENQTLATHAGVHDFVISSRFISMLLAQISEQPGMREVYETIFEESGSEIYLKPAHLYFSPMPRTVTFADLIGAAQTRGEVCLGVRFAAEDRQVGQNYGVHLIPDKTTEMPLCVEDHLVVLAEDET